MNAVRRTVVVPTLAEKRLPHEFTALADSSKLQRQRTLRRCVSDYPLFPNWASAAASHRLVRMSSIGICAFALAWFTIAETARSGECDEEVLAEIALAARDELHDKAIEIASRALTQRPALAEIYYLRGRSRFCVGQFDQAVADFDKYVELRPELASQQWERGIALYYAGQFQRGAEQFELYQTYHDNDVENSVWRFLCRVPADGIEEARRSMLPIRDDRRIPMMQVYALFRGTASVADVLAAVEKDKPDESEKAARLFYAHLYIGLYYEALGDKEQAKKYILQAADEHRQTKNINRYMWAVADVHARRYRE